MQQIQGIFFLVAIVFTFLNINERFFSSRASIYLKKVMEKFIKYTQTTVSYETRKLSEIEFPVYISLFATPGYNISLLRLFGFLEEFQFFRGNASVGNGRTHINWGNGTLSAKGTLGWS